MKHPLFLVLALSLFASSSAFALGNGCYKFPVDTFRNGGGTVTYYLWIGRGTYRVEAGNIASLSLVENGLCGESAADYANTSYSAYCRHLQGLGQTCDLR